MGTCGGFGQGCCTTGEPCVASATCNPMNTCVLSAATGGLGQPCADMNGAPFCREGRCIGGTCQAASSCGNLNDVCCSDGSAPCAGTNAVCFGGRCRTTDEVGCGGPGAICCQSTNCATGLRCADNRCSSADTSVCADLGNACSNAGTCCGGAAACRSTEVNGTDKCCARAGMMASNEADCCGMLSFSGSTCVSQPPGSPCLADSDCASQRCDGGTRTSLGRCCGGGGAMCTTSVECCGGGVCGPSAGRNVCLLPLGNECRSPTDCISGRCESGRCTPSRLAERCRPGTADCETGLECQGTGELGTCVQTGTSCTATGADCSFDDADDECCAGAFCDEEIEKCVAFGSCLDLARSCVPGGRECCGGLICSTDTNTCIRRPAPCKTIGQSCTYSDFEDECCGTAYCDGATSRCTALPTCRSRNEACGTGVSQPCCAGLACNGGLCGTPTSTCRELSQSCNPNLSSDECCAGTFCYSLTSTCEEMTCNMFQQSCSSFLECCGRLAPGVFCHPTFSSGGNQVCCGIAGQKVGSSADCCGGMVRSAATQECMKRNTGEPCLDNRDCNSGDCNTTTRTCR